MKNKKIGLKNKLFKPRSHDYKVLSIRTETNGGLLKTLIIALLIAVQLGFLIYLHISFALAFKWWILVCFILSVLCSIVVLSSDKNGLSKAVWIIFLLLCFTFSVPIYILSDERIFFRKAKKRYIKVFERAKNYSGVYTPPNAKQNVVADTKYLYNSGGFISYKNSTVKYFPSGYLFFEEVLKEVEKAEKFIFIEYYIVADGVLFNRLFDILKRKAGSGVTVRLIYDDMGSHRCLSRKTKKKLNLAGIKFKPFNRLVPIFAVGLNYRDHRKMVIIDGKVAFTGGCNLADEYINEKRMHGYWKDNGVKVNGQAVDGFSLIFLKQWEYLSKVKEDFTPYLNNFIEKESDYTVVPYADGLEYKLPIGKNVYENIISGATEKLFVMTPYFIPDDCFINLLMNKALSGVDVRVFIPDIPDKNYVYLVSRNNAEKLIDSGVKIYVVKNTFLHAKVVMSESAVSTGSINVDLRSFYQQFENAIYTDSKDFLLEVEKDFFSLESKSLLLTSKNLKRKNPFYRFIAGIMQIFAPLM